jgi:hydrogen cyanide synthase HcnB
MQAHEMNTSAPVIVGAGPAGLSAAIRLAQQGIASVLIDEAPKVGGVVYRGPLRGGVSLDYLGEKYKQAMCALHADYDEHKHLIRVHSMTRVVGIDAGKKLALLGHDDHLGEMPFGELVLATGCHERSVPFPGWMLPGVMLLGGLQLQIKSSVVKPRGPVVIVGSGPLLPLVACQLCRAGVAVAGVYEACSLRNMAKETLALLNQPQLLLDGLSMLAFLKRRHVPVHFGWGIVEAYGARGFNRAVVAPYDGDWQPDLARAQMIDAGTLAVGYGLLPRTQLSQLLGLAHAYRDDGALAVTVDAWQRSSQADVYVAGDMAGVKGGEAAMLQGTIAALAILQRRAAIPAQQAQREQRDCRARLMRIARFRAGFDRISAAGPGLLNLPRPDTVVCRCENVSSAQIDRALEQGVEDFISLKMRTRVSMGDCQGKVCVAHCADRLRRATGGADVGWTRPRFPLDPLPFSVFAREQQ